MTGFHGLHVIGGICCSWARSPRRSPAHAARAGRAAVEVCAYYWHFVDVVWVAMFATIYLLQ